MDTLTTWHILRQKLLNFWFISHCFWPFRPLYDESDFTFEFIFLFKVYEKKTAFSFRYDWHHLICQISSVYLSIYCEQDFDTSEEYIHDNNIYFVANPQIFSSRNKFSSNFLIIKMTHLKKYLRVSSQWNTIRKWDSK